MAASKSDFIQIRISAADKARLRRLARDAGQDLSTYVLGRAIPQRATEFARLVAAVRGAGLRHALADLHDFLSSLSAREFGDAVERDPLRKSDPFVTNYVAAMVEHAAVQRGLPSPQWSLNVRPLEHPWFASDLLSLRLHLLTNSPAAFRRRNLYVDSVVGARV